MAGRVTLLIDRIREAKGPFFVARINLRVRFPLGRGEVSDSPELERQILDVCRELGFDATELAGGAAAK